MKKRLLFFFFGIVLCDKVVEKPKYIWNEEEGVKTSRFDNILMSVETKKLDVKISEPMVSVILPGAFEKSKQIIFLSLYLMKGPIVFGEDSLKELNNLEVIYFKEGLVTLYDDTFKYTPSLRRIQMKLSQFTTELAKKFDRFTYLMSLRIFDGHLGNIKAYSFSSNNIDMVFLELSSCSIVSIEAKAFATLINLAKLDLSNNTLMRIAPGVFDGLSKLTTLILKNNNIYRIRETELHGLIQLTFFDISYNDLTEIASKAFHNLKVKDFMLNNNRLKKIDKELFNYPKSNMIRNIYLQNNLIDRIDDGAFAGLRMNILNLTRNKLRFVGDKMFEGCTSILQLDLAENLITRISDNPFNNCQIKTINFFIDDQQSLKELVSRKIPGSIKVYWRQ